MNTENKKLNGVAVKCVIPNSCADNAGVRMGDIILAFNGMRTETLTDYVKAKMLMPERENVLID